MNQDFRSYIEENKALSLSVLREIIALRSVLEAPAAAADGSVYPFGQGVQDAFVYFLKKAEELGFATKDVDHYGGHVDFGQGKEIIGILGHLDVVPEGTGWDFEPYSGQIEDGWILGRGTTDDKGPMVAALFAMKALKDAGFEPARKVRLIIGLDEETEWKGMDYYLDHEVMPDFGFTPDGDFPVIAGEMGILNFEIAAKLANQPNEGLLLKRMSGGTAVNMVPDSARAVVNFAVPKARKGSAAERKNQEQVAVVYSRIRGLAAEDDGITVKTVGKSLEITAKGISAHGAMPEKGRNAISVLFRFLGRLDFALEEINDFVNFYNQYIGFCLDGSKLGCGLEDAPSGKLIFNVGMAESDGKAIRLSCNVRYPVTACGEQVYEGMAPALDAYNLGVVKQEEMEPLYFPPESPLVDTLMHVYREKTGDTESQPLVIGGGTYAKAVQNTVAFGALFPGDEDRMHQKNERLSVERFMKMTEIYAEAIYRLASPEFSFSEGETELEKQEENHD